MEILDDEILKQEAGEKEIEEMKNKAKESAGSILNGRIGIIVLMIFTTIGIALRYYYNPTNSLSITVQVIELPVYAGAFWLSSIRPKLAFFIVLADFSVSSMFVFIITNSSNFSLLFIKLLVMLFFIQIVVASAKFEKLRRRLLVLGHEVKVPPIISE